MGIYAALGVAQAVSSLLPLPPVDAYCETFQVFFFFLSFAFSLMTLAAGFKMFRGALRGVTHAPVRWCVVDRRVMSSAHSRFGA
jgi:hypothetical protein